jgi:hypothetical protein
VAIRAESGALEGANDTLRRKVINLVSEAGEILKNADDGVIKGL